MRRKLKSICRGRGRKERRLENCSSHNMRPSDIDIKRMLLFGSWERKFQSGVQLFMDGCLTDGGLLVLLEEGTMAKSRPATENPEPSFNPTPQQKPVTWYQRPVRPKADGA